MCDQGVDLTHETVRVRCPRRRRSLLRVGAIIAGSSEISGFLVVADLRGSALHAVIRRRIKAWNGNMERVYAGRSLVSSERRAVFTLSATAWVSALEGRVGAFVRGHRIEQRRVVVGFLELRTCSRTKTEPGDEQG